jgi:hypothetical protein
MTGETIQERDRRLAVDVETVARRVGDDCAAWERVETLLDRVDRLLAEAGDRIDPKLVAGLHDWLRRPVADARGAVIFARQSGRCGPRLVKDGRLRLPDGTAGDVVARYWDDPDYIPAIFLEDQEDRS